MNFVYVYIVRTGQQNHGQSAISSEAFNDL